jgi:outer membrane receptor protein involved in Fe transport
MLTVVGSFALLGMAQGAAAQDQDSAGADQDRDEIIVTATRRETTLQETPLAVSAIGAEQIEKRNLVGMEDYLASVPGVGYQDRGNGSNTITIRGIGTASQISANTPTGSYFGEVPVTGLGPQLNGNQAGNGDVKMIDVARVEILRGPQGTLFGSGALGGAVRVIPNAPKLNAFEGKVIAEYSNTARRGSHNYSIQGMVNIPVIDDQLAVRLVGYRYLENGFVDNVAASRPLPTTLAAKALGVATRDRQHIGGQTTTGFRGSLLWQPMDGLSLTLMHLYQKINQDGLSGVDLGVSQTDYLQSRVRTGPNSNSDEGTVSDLHISNAIVEYDWDWGNILNSTSFVDSQARSQIDISFFDPLIPGSPFYLGVYAAGSNDKEVFINETRFTSSWDFPVQLIAGLYYENRRSLIDANLRYSGAGAIPPLYSVIGTINEGPRRILQTKQKAVFGEVAFTPWKPFTLTVGARYYDFKQGYPLYLSVVSPTPVVHPQNGQFATVDGVNWKVNAALKLSEEFLLYGQWAQGFREGQFQNALDPVFDNDGDGLYEFQDGSERRPTEGLLNPDKVDTYEVGLKWQSNSGDVSGALTGYYTNWTGIPVSLLTTPLGAAFFFNAGKAVAKGIEFELNGRLPDDWHAQFSAAWSSTTLGNDAESLSLSRGIRSARLPGSPNHNAYAALEKRFRIGENQAFVRGDWTYVGGYISNLNQTGRAGDYHLLGASAGITFDRFKLSVFGKNLANRSDLTWIDNTLGSGRAYRLRPRTIGISVGATF